MKKRKVIKENDAKLKMVNFLSQQFNLDQEIINILVDIFKLKKYKKKELIISDTENIDKVCYIVDGLVRIYYHRENKEITNWFIEENGVFMPVYHILTGNPNNNNYEALKTTIVLETSYSKLEKIYAFHPQLQLLGRKMVESYYAMFLAHSHNVLFLSAEERYMSFIEKKSDLLNIVALKHIASYLGISQETLSRIRAKKMIE
ncbi:MAG: Crp/Fnr family transcriptional regulator [Chitinophagales bacterium]